MRQRTRRPARRKDTAPARRAGVGPTGTTTRGASASARGQSNEAQSLVSGRAGSSRSGGNRDMDQIRLLIQEVGPGPRQSADLVHPDSVNELAKHIARVKATNRTADLSRAEMALEDARKCLALNRQAETYEALGKLTIELDTEAEASQEERVEASPMVTEVAELYAQVVSGITTAVAAVHKKARGGRLSSADRVHLALQIARAAQPIATVLSPGGLAEVLVSYIFRASMGGPKGGSSRGKQTAGGAGTLAGDTIQLFEGLEKILGIGDIKLLELGVGEGLSGFGAGLGKMGEGYSKGQAAGYAVAELLSNYVPNIIAAAGSSAAGETVKALGSWSDFLGSLVGLGESLATGKVHRSDRASMARQEERIGKLFIQYKALGYMAPAYVEKSFRSALTRQKATGGR